MKIQQILPFITNYQHTELCDNSISYMSSGTKVSIFFNDINKISFTPLQYFLAGVIPVTIFDIIIFDKEKNKHKLINVSGKGYKYIADLLINYPEIQAEHNKKEFGTLINGFVRFL